MWHTVGCSFVDKLEKDASIRTMTIVSFFFFLEKFDSRDEFQKWLYS